MAPNETPRTSKLLVIALVPLRWGPHTRMILFCADIFSDWQILFGGCKISPEAFLCFMAQDPYEDRTHKR